MGAITVTTAPTRLDSATKSGSGISGQGSSIAFYNNGAATVYVEPNNSNVSTTSGAPVPAGTWSGGYDLDSSESLWAVTASGTADCRVNETGVA